MDKYKIIQVKESVFADNDREADRVRQQLKKQGTFLLNLMSSPGSGKTTTLLRTVEGLKDQLRMGVMEADIDSDVDAAAMANAGVRSIQLHTGGMCHLDAGMNWKWAVTSPPQTMPISCSGAWCRGNSRMQERRWSSSSRHSWMLRPSTAPPPMVPTRRPSAPTSICAPAFRGALPRSAISVTSTVSRRFSTS